MAERDSTTNQMVWAFLWLLAALIAALVVFFILKMLVSDDPAAGLVFGGVTFMLVGFLLVRYGPGPAASAAHEPVAAHRAHGHAEPVHVAPAANEPAAPVAREPVAPVAEPVVPEAPAAASPISERVREAARAAGEAARAAAGETAAPPVRLMGAAPARPSALAAPRDGGPDDLRRIKGVGVKLTERLHSLGYYHFDQIAAWTAEEIVWVDSNLEGFNGRATRDDWVGQARILAAGGETEHSQKVDRGESD